MNKSGDENRSVRNTKKRLQEALLTLLQKKPINQITVKELTELADVNRGTFYFHYTDVYDMLHKTEDRFFNDFNDVLNGKELNISTSFILTSLRYSAFLKRTPTCAAYFSAKTAT